MLIKSNRGFTLIEVMAVVVILGILAAVAVPRFMNNEKYEVKNVALALAREIRYAQQEAMKIKYEPHKDVPQKVTVEFNVYGGQSSYSINLPNEAAGKKDIELPGGINFTGQSAREVIFDHNGETSVISYVYLEDKAGNKVRLEVSKPWGRVRIENY